jgi:glutamate/aspartate transport system substrate-binding protein
MPFEKLQLTTKFYPGDRSTMRIVLHTFLIGCLLASPLAAQELQGTLQQIQKSGIIKIGYRQSQPPMSSLDKDGNPNGYSVDLCRDIAIGVKNKINREVTIEFIPVTAADRFEALTTNKIDILCGSTTNTLARREIVDFTQLTFVTGGSYMALKGRKIKNNFDGKKIGVVKGTTTAVALKNLFLETETVADIVSLNSASEGFNDLKEGKIDILTADQVVLIGLAIKSGNPSQFTILPDMFSYEPFSLAVRRNDADFRLIADRTISDLYRSGQIKTIYERWFGDFSQEMPSALQAMIEINSIPEE